MDSKRRINASDSIRMANLVRNFKKQKLKKEQVTEVFLVCDTTTKTTFHVLAIMTNVMDIIILIQKQRLDNGNIH